MSVCLEAENQGGSLQQGPTEKKGCVDHSPQFDALMSIHVFCFFFRIIEVSLKPFIFQQSNSK